MKKAYIETLLWQHIRDEVRKVNPKFASAVDAVSPNKNYPIYKVRYPFGAKIFDEGILNLPNKDGTLVPLHDKSLSKTYGEQLSYRTIPICFVLKKSVENSVELDDRVIPLTVFEEGSILGAWEALDPVYSYFIKLGWNLTSGARSIFMLPKISEVFGYKKIKRELGININAPKRSKDHWHVFKTIADHSQVEDLWNSEILIFPKKWFEQLYDKGKTWSDFKNFLYQKAWLQSMYWRFFITQNLIWNKFSSIIKKQNVNWGNYQLETVKHLISLAAGALPSFKAADYSESSAPIKYLQEVFLDFYGISYAPTIMIPTHFTVTQKSPSYYSINEPSLIESTPKTREISNIMQVTREIKMLFDCFFREREGIFKKELLYYSLLSTVKFEFIYTKYDPYNLLIQSNNLSEKDPGLLLMPSNYSDRSFCYSNSFMRGSVLISAR